MIVNNIKSKNIQPDEILVSLDVTSLFTNLSKELILNGIENRWNDIKNNTKLGLTQFLDAIEFLLTSACFTFNGNYFD